MNVIDILILLLLAYAAYSGFREGLIIQIFSLVGIILSLWVASKYSTKTAEMLHIEGDYSELLGFLIATVIVLIVIAFAGRMIHRLANLTGLGFVDRFLGASLSIVKFVLMLSVSFTAINLANQTFEMFDNEELKNSKLYMPIANISNHFTPAWDWINTQISESGLVDKLPKI